MRVSSCLVLLAALALFVPAFSVEATKAPKRPHYKNTILSYSHFQPLPTSNTTALIRAWEKAAILVKSESYAKTTLFFASHSDTDYYTIEAFSDIAAFGAHAAHVQNQLLGIVQIAKWVSLDIHAPKAYFPAIEASVGPAKAAFGVNVTYQAIVNQYARLPA